MPMLSLCAHISARPRCERRARAKMRERARATAWQSDEGRVEHQERREHGEKKVTRTECISHDKADGCGGWGSERGEGIGRLN
eukprot:1127236-Pleurochrysis_carterae.AAC.3